MDQTQSQLSSRQTVNTRPKLSSQRMTEREREDLLRQGRCFYCKERGHIATLCPRKQKQRNDMFQ
jgi:hypothetical protein